MHYGSQLIKIWFERFYYEIKCMLIVRDRMEYKLFKIGKRVINVFLYVRCVKYIFCEEDTLIWIFASTYKFSTICICILITWYISDVYFRREKNNIPAIFLHFFGIPLEVFRWPDPDNVTEAYIPATCVHLAKHVAKESCGLFRLALAANDRSRGGIKVVNDKDWRNARAFNRFTNIPL